MDELPSNSSSLVIQPEFERAVLQSQLSLNLLWCVLIYIRGYSGKIFQTPCTGSLLRRNLVLTSLSCLLAGDDRLPDVASIQIYVRNKQRLVGQVIHTSTKYGKPFDLALVECTSAFIDSFPTLPSEEFFMQPSCTLSGYGTDGPVKLRNFNTKSFAETQVWMCNQYSLQEYRLCLHFINLMPCQGDVGAPLVCNGVLHGIYNPPIIPSHKTCINRYGTHFTPLYLAVGWITRVESTIDSVQLSWLANPWFCVVAAIAVLASIGAIYYSIMYIVQSRFSVFFMICV